MSRKKIAQFKASCKDPDLQKSIKNFIDYRRRRGVLEEEILAQLLAEYGASPYIQLTPEFAAESELTEASSSSEGDAEDAFSNASGQGDELNLEICPASGQDGELNPAFSVASGQGDELSLASSSASGQSDGLNAETETAPEVSDILEAHGPVWQPSGYEPTDEQVAAVIAEMQQLQTSQVRNVAEGVVIELPFTRVRMNKVLPPEPAKQEEPEVEKTAETDPMRLAPQPSPTRTIFSTLALMALIGFISHYLIAATSALYGTLAAGILVAIPLAVVFFVNVPVLRYVALAVFLMADLWSLQAIYKKDLAVIEETSLSLNPEYQRLKLDYSRLTIERDAVNPGSHPSVRRRITADAQKAADRMTEIEQSSKTDQRADAETTKTEVTLGIRALFLLAAALLAHPLLHYSTVLNYDAFMKKAFGHKRG